MTPNKTPIIMADKSNSDENSFLQSNVSLKGKPTDEPKVTSNSSAVTVVSKSYQGTIYGLFFLTCIADCLQGKKLIFSAKLVV